MDILLLHGAIGSSSQMLPLGNLLTGKLKVSYLDFRGHASNSADIESLSIPLFARQVLEWMKEKKLETIDIFGYSMGGYVGLYLAKHHPEKVNRIFTLATKFRWTPDIARQEIKMLDPQKIAEKVPQFAQVLAERHGKEHWENVLDKTARMMMELGNRPALGIEDLQSVNHKVRIGIGDRDRMVTLEETVEVYKALPNASLLVMPDTAHPIENVNTQALAHQIHNFFD